MFAGQHFRRRPLVFRKVGFAYLFEQKFPGARSPHTSEANMNWRCSSSSSAEARMAVGLAKMIAPLPWSSCTEEFKLGLKISRLLGGGLLQAGSDLQVRRRVQWDRLASAACFLSSVSFPSESGFARGIPEPGFCCNSCSTPRFEFEGRCA